MSFYNKYKWLMPLLAFTALLVFARMLRTSTSYTLFIPWNLFLAWLPLFFSYYLTKFNSKLVSWGLFVLWLLFFPNSMYIVTDLFHLRDETGVPKWFDLLILFSAAINGMIMGVLSLMNAEAFLNVQLKAKWVSPAIFAIFLLCGYGVYMGRYLDFNSWDVFRHPFSIMRCIADDFLNPIANHQMWMLTVLFGVWMSVLYRFLKKVRVG